MTMSKDEINVDLFNKVQRLKEKLRGFTSVFELVEHTSDETYHPIGIYKTYEEAKAVIDKAGLDNRPVYDYSSDDCGHPEIIKILERQFGESENGDEVYCCYRERFYSEEHDEYYWKITKEHGKAIATDLSCNESRYI